MTLTLRNAVNSVVEQITHRSPFLTLSNMSNASILAVFLFVLWIPLALLVGCFDRLRSHEVVLMQGIHIDAKVLLHQADSQIVRKAANFEGFARHYTGPRHSVPSTFPYAAVLTRRSYRRP